MRKLIVVSILILFIMPGLYAQQWTTSGSNIYNSNTGNVGVGTTNPNQKLSIAQAVSTGYNSMLSFNELTNNGNNSMGIDFNFAGLSGFPWGSTGRIEVARQSTSSNFDMLFHTATLGVLSEKMRILNNGNVGIGSTAPGAKLTIAGSAATYWTNSAISLNETSGVATSRNWVIGNASGPNYGDLAFHVGAAPDESPSGIPVMVLTKAGTLGIGTSAPAAGTLLDVNGTTYSRKLYVGMPDANTIANMGSNNLLAVNGTAVFVKAKVAVYGSTWPDYVFSLTYKLTPLDSLEQFIQLNKHLPEVPSAGDVQKNGIDLGDNQTLLLKKIEELTLFVIEQNKQSEELQKIIKNQDTKDELQSKKISELENKLKALEEKMNHSAAFKLKNKF
jgi:hypothetical protein